MAPEEDVHYMVGLSAAKTGKTIFDTNADNTEPSQIFSCVPTENEEDLDELLIDDFKTYTLLHGI